MPVRIYDIAKKLGIESKEVLAKAKELGITGARVPSSSLDKITAEFLAGHFTPIKPPPPPAPALPEPVIQIIEAPPPPVEPPAISIAPPPVEPKVVEESPPVPVAPLETPSVADTPLVEARAPVEVP